MTRMISTLSDLVEAAGALLGLDTIIPKSAGLGAFECLVGERGAHRVSSCLLLFRCL